jgi:lysophospholipase L1-like esterase
MNFFTGKVLQVWLLTALFFIAGEMGMRYRHTMRHGAGQPVFVDDPIEGRYPIPNSKRQSISVNESVNEHGYRGHSFALEPPEGTVRLVCLGDSTTWGGTTDESTFPARLEKDLNREFKGKPPVEVVNAGVAGIGSVNAKKHLERRIVKIKPQYLLIYPPANDISILVTKRGNTGNIATTYFGLWSPGQWRQRHSVFFNAFLSKVKRFYLSPRTVANRYVPFPANGRSLLRQLLSVLVNTAQQLGIKPVVLAHCYPIRSGQTSAEAQRYLKGHFFELGAAGAVEAVTVQNGVARDVAQQAGIPFIDVENAVPSDDEFFQQDGLHFNDKGNELFAEKLAEELIKTGIVP